MFIIYIAVVGVPHDPSGVTKSFFTMLYLIVLTDSLANFCRRVMLATL